MATPKPALLLLLIPLIMASAGAYTTSMHAPAVLANASNDTAGALTTIMLNLTPGTGAVVVGGPSSVASSTLDSAVTAAAAASAYMHVNESKYDFNYTIMDRNISVSGPSAGLVFTLLAVSAFEHKQIQHNFTATGTISGAGQVGLIGGVLNKVSAAKAHGMGFVLVPYAGGKGFENMLYYIAQQTYGIPLVQVSNVSQALGYINGLVPLQPTQPNITVSYPLASIGDSNVTCSGCNASAFGGLVGFTLNFTNSTISSIGGSYSGAKSELASDSRLFGQIAGMGYLYTAADFAFLDFMQAFTLANTANYTVAGASNLINSTSNYCASVVAPELTSSNYEYVLGGELRQYWANATLNQSQQTLGAVQDADGLVNSVYQTASSVGWCKAAAELYSIAPGNGTYVQTSVGLKTAAASAINQARSYGSSMYLQAAIDAYNSGDYAVALYSATYASVFTPGAPNVSEAQMYGDISANIANATRGLWPPQFASQAEFYMRSSLASKGANSSVYAADAYTTSLLAVRLQKDNSVINASFVPVSGPGVSGAQVLALEQEVSQLGAILVVNTLLLFVALVVLLYMALNHRRSRAPGRRRRAR